MMIDASLSRSRGEQAQLTLGGDDGDDFDLRWIGRSTGLAERRQVVVLAVGFAPFNASDPEEIAEVLGRRRDFVAGIVARHGGRVGRLDHDLQLAYWGWPIAGEADTQRAVGAALEIASSSEPRARCGIDAGIAITQETDDRPDGIGLVGEMLGTAKVLQGLADWGSVVVSETVRRLVVGTFELEPRAQDAGVGLSWLVSRRETPRSSRMAPGAGELVGRTQELAAMLACWRSTTASETRRLRLEGPAGVGKSAMLAELERHVIAAGGVFIVADCRPEMQQVPLDPIGRLVESMQETLERSVSDVPCGLGSVAATCGADTSSESDRLAALQRLLIGWPPSLPLVLALEHLQWSDGETLSAIEELGRLASPAPFLLATTRRVETVTGERNRQEGQWNVLHIGLLSRDDIGRLVAQSEAGAKLGEDVRRRIMDHADGVPRFALELASLCAERPDSAAHRRLLARPNRINSVLTGRLDALATLKPLVQAASVLGHKFDARVLAGVLDMDVRLLTERLEMLERLGIVIRNVERPKFSYRFTHALLWGQAYGSVLKSRRRMLHAKIAAEYTRNHAVLCAATPEIVALHCTKSGDLEAAFYWWRKAAHAAASTGSTASAISHINQALAAKQQAPHVCTAFDEAELMSLLGAQLHSLRGSASADTVAAYDRALQLIADLPERPADLDLNIAWGLATIQLVRGDIRDAVITTGRLLEEAREHGRGDIELLALRMHGTARLMAGRVQEAVELLTTAADLYVPGAHGEIATRFVSDPGAVTQAHLAAAHALAGNVDASRAARTRALSLAAGIDHPHTSANVLGVLSIAAIHLDEPGTAAALARASQAIAEKHGYAYWVARARVVLAWHVVLRQPDPDVELIDEAVDRYQETGAARAALLACCLAAEVAIKARMPRRALRLLKPARTKGEHTGEWLYMPEILRLEALALLQLEQPDRASIAKLLDRAEAMALGQGTLVFAARAAKTRANVGHAASSPPVAAANDA